MNQPDEIQAEIYAVRERIAAECGDNPRRHAKQLLEFQAAQGIKVIDRSSLLPQSSAIKVQETNPEN